MPTFSIDQLRQLAGRILRGAGATEREAELVATELANANRVGHDSHGVIRLGQYVGYMRNGQIKPGAEIRVVVDRPGIAVIDGGHGFGQVVAAHALELARLRARQNASFTVFCRNTNHVGRLGSYTHRAALDGFAALMAVNGPAGGGVIPWGGLDRRLGTNPISIAAPRGNEPVVLDMTSSATAEGKLRVAAQKGAAIPEGWVIDRDGNPSTDPNDFYGGGAILPLGGSMGFKGYGLGVMVDIFCGILSGAGIARTDLPPGSNGVWLYLVDISQVMEPEQYANWIAKYGAWIKSSRKSPEIDEILLPGEIEAQRATTRNAGGVEIPAETWRQLQDVATSVGVSMETCCPPS